MGDRFVNVGLTREDMGQMMAVNGNCPECGSQSAMMVAGIEVHRAASIYKCDKCGYEVRVPMKMIAEMVREAREAVQ